MPMQVFEFQADSSVSLLSPAAINRKSCDHCFLNRKTCDKVREEAETGDKCGRCAKDNRPCTFTPTVHLYHIADCVGRHQCRAKVIQAMGGRKKEIKFKTIEIPIVCDMDSDTDLALFEFIQRQPNLLVYNNRIKSFLAQDMLGLSPDNDSASSSPRQFMPSFSDSLPSGSPNGRNKRSFVMDDTPSSYGQPSPTHGPSKYRIMSPVEPYIFQEDHATSMPIHISQHTKSASEDQSWQGSRPGYSPRAHPAQNYHSSRHTSMPEVPAYANNLSSIVSPSTLSPIEAMNHYRRHSETVAAASLAASTMGSYGGFYPQPQQQQQHQSMAHNQATMQQNHPYAQQSPYPQATYYRAQEHHFQTYRTPSPMRSPQAPSSISPSPLPPSPLELSLAISTQFGSMNSSSHQNLPSLFDTNMTMSSQQQHHHAVSVGTVSSAASSAASPALAELDYSTSATSVLEDASTGAAPPMIITTTNEDGNEVGFYYAVPTVNLNPGCSDADLFQDFAMGDALGEDYVWIENLFDEVPAAGTSTAVGAALTSTVLPGTVAPKVEEISWADQYATFATAGRAVPVLQG